MPISLFRRALPALAACGLLAACGDGSGPSEPVPGQLTVRVDVPNSDRAMVVQVSGPGPITALQAASSNGRAFGSAGGASVRAAVFGAFLGESDVLLITVPDVNRAESYTAQVVEAADANNQLRASLAGYSARVTR
jgi:hypothetical protein